MTKEEAIHIIGNVNANTNCNNCFYTYYTCEDCMVETALNMAIEALENQQSIIAELEKIKSEIRKKQEINCDMNCNKCEWNHPAVDIKKVEIVKKDIEIIDNHISEIKGENK